MRVAMLGPLTVGALLLASLPARASGTTECDENSHLGTTAPDFYACTEDKGPNPLEDCFHAGVLLVAGDPVEVHGCDP